MIWRFLPVVGAVLLVAIVCCWRPWIQFRRYGIWGFALFRPNRPGQILRDSLGVVVFVLFVAQAIAVASRPESAAPPGGDRRPLLATTGAVLLFGGIVLLIAAQLHLGASWRIGIAERAKPGLVTSGLYQFCRNPIFLAMLVILAGYTLLIPTPLSLAMLIGSYVGIRQQVTAEEAYLVRVYGESYREYGRRIGRFLPGIGRLR